MKLLNLLAAAVLAVLLPGSVIAAGQPAPPAAATNRVAAVELPIPESVFNIPLTPRQGRNPFFPNSSAAVPVVKTNMSNVIDSTALILNGITGPPRRMAMINGRTFEAGEAGDVKLSNGVRIPIQCLEILDDRVIIKVGGQRRELVMPAKLTQ